MKRSLNSWKKLGFISFVSAILWLCKWSQNPALWIIKSSHKIELQTGKKSHESTIVWTNYLRKGNIRIHKDFVRQHVLAINKTFENLLSEVFLTY